MHIFTGRDIQRTRGWVLVVCVGLCEFILIRCTVEKCRFPQCSYHNSFTFGTDPLGAHILVNEEGNGSGQYRRSLMRNIWSRQFGQCKCIFLCHGWFYPDHHGREFDRPGCVGGRKYILILVNFPWIPSQKCSEKSTWHKALYLRPWLIEIGAFCWSECVFLSILVLLPFHVLFPWINSENVFEHTWD